MVFLCLKPILHPGFQVNSLCKHTDRPANLSVTYETLFSIQLKILGSNLQWELTILGIYTVCFTHSANEETRFREVQGTYPMSARNKWQTWDLSPQSISKACGYHYFLTASSNNYADNQRTIIIHDVVIIPKWAGTSLQNIY